MRRLTLAIDTSQKAAGVAVFEGDRLTAAGIGERGAPVSETLNPLVARVLSESGGERGAIGRVIVASGHGSATGLRFGIAFARGLADALGLEYREAPVLEALLHLILPPLRSEALSAAYGGANTVYSLCGGTERKAKLGEWIESFREPDALGEGPIVVAADLAERLGPRTEWPVGLKKATVVGNIARLLGGF